MKLNNEQYNEFVEKLADEILEGQLEKQAGLKFGKNNIGKALKETVTGKGIRDAIKDRDIINKSGIGGFAAKNANKNLAKEIAKTTGAYAGAAGAAGGAGAAAIKAIKDKKEDRQLEEKAAEVFEYALRKIAACEEMYADGVSDQEACIEVLAEAGLYDEHGFNKEAAEESEEAMEFATEVSNVYDEAMDKIAAAEECYEEAVSDLQDSMEVLKQFGYEFE